jgi:acetyl esterase/lipase
MPSEAYENLVTMLSAGRVTPETPIDQSRAGLDAMETILPLAPDISTEDTSVGGVGGRWVTAATPGDRTVLHLHGGGYVIGSSRSHTPIASLAAPAPAAIDDSVAAYRALLDAGHDPGRIIVTGDSAGGGLAIATLVRIRDDGLPMPASAAVISPWADLTGDYPSMREKAEEDIILSPELLAFWAGLYAGSLPVDDPRLSPVRADLRGLPQLHIQVGTREVLLDDARQLADKASADGVDVTLDVVDDMIHIWPTLGAGVVPEAQEAIDRIAKFVG